MPSMASTAAINNLGSYAHNPRGNLWFKDESTYGHKLLMKMGWNKGKGLGKNEDGITENLKVKFRSTSSGLGFKDDAYANVMKSEYESILKNLNSEFNHSKGSDDKRTIEKNDDCIPKAKVVTGKIRYPKLFFGKDVSKYTEKDMKSIFICGQLCKDKEDEEKNCFAPKEKESESKTVLEGDTYTSNQSISEYFAKKMNEKKISSIKHLNGAKEFQQASSESENLNAESVASTTKKLSKRKRKSKEKEIDDEANLSMCSKEIKSESEIVDENNLTDFSTKKSPKKKKKNSETSMFEVNCDTSQMNGSKEESENCNNKELYNSSSKTAMSILTNDVKNCEDDSFCRQSKKRKRSQKHQNECDMLNKNEIFSKSTFMSEAESFSESPKKKKKCKSKNKDIEHFSETSASNKSEQFLESGKFLNGYLTSEISEDKTSSNSDSSSKKKRKLKKMLKQKFKSCLKSKSKSYSMKNVSFNETVSYRVIDSNFESKDHLCADESSVKHSSVCELVNEGNQCIENSSSGQQFNSDEEKIRNDSFSDVLEKPSETYQGIDFSLCLPSSRSPYYNPWIESQSQALKMKTYKNMLKNIQQHEILSTTNMLSIKGYGNWGFK